MGSGEAYGQSAGARGAYYLGDGLFVSIDSGKSWAPIASTALGNPISFSTGWQLVWNLAHDASAHDTIDELYAACYNQVQRSYNGGKTWTNLMPGGYFTDVAVSSKGVVYATSSSDGQKKGIFRGNNNGALVNINPSFLGATYKRIVIGIDPNDENVVYFLLNTDGFGKSLANFRGEERPLPLSIFGRGWHRRQWCLGRSFSEFACGFGFRSMECARQLRHVGEGEAREFEAHVHRRYKLVCVYICILRFIEYSKNRWI
jgi:hypothetical protein